MLDNWWQRSSDALRPIFHEGQRLLLPSGRQPGGRNGADSCFASCDCGVAVLEPGRSLKLSLAGPGASNDEPESTVGSANGGGCARAEAGAEGSDMSEKLITGVCSSASSSVTSSSASSDGAIEAA
eukprot:2177504-Prymnesium_polylepis.1